MSSDNYHFVQHFLRPGDYIQTQFSCSAPEGAKCRVACKRCSDAQYEACICDPLLGQSPDLQDFGTCLVLQWLSQDAPEESYIGERQPIRGPEPQPIVEEWTGDDYGWDYAT